MKKHPKTLPASAPRREPTEDEIRDYAYHLYEQSGCVPGRDADNWLEAKACLEASIPREHSHKRLHRHRHPEAFDDIAIVAVVSEVGPRIISLQSPVDGGTEVGRISVRT